MKTHLRELIYNQYSVTTLLLVNLSMLAITPQASAQEYTSSNVPLSIEDSVPNTITSTLAIPGQAGYIIDDINVTLDIVHTWTSDLDITLIHPDGTRIDLSSGNGSSGDNYSNTTFDQQASTSITAGSAPYAGTFRPEGDLQLLNGKSSSGTWKLEIKDNASQDGGSLNSWSLSISQSLVTQDTDNDSLPDYWESKYGLDPNDDGSTNPNNGPLGDPDQDGLSNYEEYQLRSYKLNKDDSTKELNPMLNDFNREYEPRPSKATLLFVIAHPDDEGIFFGGALPYYTQTLDLPVVCISMTSGDYHLAPPVREAEMRNAMWEYGLRNQPIFPRFRDWYDSSENINATWDIWNDNVIGNNDEVLGKQKAVEYIATQIRRYRPEVVATHDTNGEYGHTNHKATAEATIEALTIAADPETDLEGLPAWQVKKLYVHLGNRNTSAPPISKLFHDHWQESSIPHPDGPTEGNLTPIQVANRGLAYHQTQGNPKVSTIYSSGETSPDWEAYPCEEWGLHTSLVGADSISPDFTIPGTTISYSGYSRSDFLQNISIDRDADLLPDDWENLYGTSNLSLTPNGDDDGDGLTNYQEFTLGSHPLLASAPGHSHLEIAPAGTTVSFTLPEASGTGYKGVKRSYTLQSSLDLIEWEDVLHGKATGTLVTHDIETANPKIFYRLLIKVE